MPAFTPRRLVAALALAHPCLLMAQTAEPARPSEDVSFRLGRIEITGRAPGPLSSRTLLTSVDVVGGSLVQDLPARNTWELYARVPGVLLTEFNQGTTSGKLSFRGFNGEGEVNAVKLLIDGIPANSNDGNMPYIDLVAPIEIEAITLVRGTNDARYGLHNIAGNSDIATRLGGNATVGRLAFGAHGLADLQLALDREGGEWSQNYAIAARNTKGWRDHSDGHRASLSGKWFYKPQGATWRVGLTARHLDVKAEEPGYLTLADSRANPDQSYAFSATDGGDRTVRQVALHADGEIGRDLSWQVKLYQNGYDDQRFVKFSAGVSQQERVTDETHRGLRALASWRPRIDGLGGFALEAGVDTERQHNRSERYNTTERTRVTRTREHDWTFDITGAFVQAVLRPLPSLKLVPGLRLDTVRGSFDNQLSGVNYAVNDYGTIRQPKFSAVWTAAPGWTGYANWGRTFQVGVGAATFKIPPRTSDLAPSINDGTELGLKFDLGGSADGRVAVWQQKASNEVYRDLNNPSGDSINIGATRRRGIDLHLKARPAPDVEAFATLTLQKGVIVEPNPATPTQRGKEIDHVPHRLYLAGVDWQMLPTLRLSTWLQGQSNYFLERDNTRGRFGSYAWLNASANWQVQSNVRVELQLKNLTDRNREYAWWDGTQTLHAPAEGRTLAASVRVDF